MIHNMIPRDLFKLNGLNPHQTIYQYQGDISNLSRFSWCEWCYFREEAHHQFPEQKEVLGRALGPTKNEGNKMCQYVLKNAGKAVPCCTLRPLTISELNSPSEKQKRDAFDTKIHGLLGDSMTPMPESNRHSPEDCIEAEFAIDEDEEPPLIVEEDSVNATGKSLYETPFYDMLLKAEVLLP